MQICKKNKFLQRTVSVFNWPVSPAVSRISEIAAMKKSRGRDAPRQLGHWAGRNGPTLSYQPGNRVRGNTSASYLPVRANHSISSGGNFIGGPPRINGVEHNLRDAWRPPSRTCRTAYACVCLCVRARARAGRTQLSGQRARSA